MHQSVRMVCASFLVEYLGVSWVEGALHCNPRHQRLHPPRCERLRPCVPEAAALCACARGRMPPHATLRTTAAPGARWFHATLVDADVAINAMMWQNAGRSGIDQVSEGVSELARQFASSS